MPPDTANTVELNTMKPIGVAEAIGLEMDIMQLARLGEIAAIKKLFDSGKYDISYRDEEGITPLHVRLTATPKMEPIADLWLLFLSSGPLLTTVMSFASFFSIPVRTSTRKAASQLLHLPCGLLRDVTTISSTSYSNMEQTPS